jgi:tetratricopeptide (TPR) repeat protein
MIREKALGLEDPWVAFTLQELAGVYIYQGRLSEAEPLYKRALAIAEKAASRVFDPISPMVALADAYRSEGRYRDAELLYIRARALQEKTAGPPFSPDDDPTAGFILHRLGQLAYLQSRYTDAKQLYNRALVITNKWSGSDNIQIAPLLVDMALLYKDEDRYAAAEPLLQRALAIRQKFLEAGHPDVAAPLYYLALLYESEGQSDRAFEYIKHAVNNLERHLRSEAEDRTDGKAENYDRVLFKYISIADKVSTNSPKERDTLIKDTFRVSQLVRPSITGGAITSMTARLAAGNDALASVVRDRQDVGNRWHWLNHAVTKSISLQPNRRDLAKENSLRDDLAATTQRLDTLNERIAAEFPAYSELSNPNPLDLKAAQAILEVDEAMLVYLVDGNETWLWALRRDSATLSRIEIGMKALAVEVAALRQRLDPALNTDKLPFDAARAYELYQRIISPAAPLLDGARLVFVVADGALESLPLGVLVTKPPEHEPQDPADHRDIAWFAREHALTVLPSVSALRALRQYATGGHAASAFVGVGDPVLAGKPEGERRVKTASLFRGALADVSAVRALPPLPEPPMNCAPSLRTWVLARRTFTLENAPQSRYYAKPGSTATGSWSLRHMG